MSSKQPAAKKAASVSAAAAAPAAEKKPRKPKAPSMSIKLKFDVMTAINGADAKTPDATVAASLTIAHGRTISAQQVGKYRKELGLASVGKQKQADLLADLAAAQARIAALEAAAVASAAPAAEPAAD
jgi:hypothetical protein